MSLLRAGYCSDLERFRADSVDSILGQLARTHVGEIVATQRDAWLRQIELLRHAVRPISDGYIAFEYLIPRMGKRADTILLADGAILVLEFKVGAKTFDRAAIRQTIDYVLDLKNFHAGSELARIVPILVATRAASVPVSVAIAEDGVSEILLANADDLPDRIGHAIAAARGEPIDPDLWFNAGYRPTPTIIEASQALYRGHSVAEITRSEASADNLGATSSILNEIIDRAKERSEKAICLVTGVPGAGKTLAGLNLASERRRADLVNAEHAVFLSGTGPLVRVLQEALARDEVARGRNSGQQISKAEAARRARAFIQNVHHFRDECVKNDAPPTERVVVFDEAQRAWDLEQTCKFMQQKRGQSSFNQSEPAFLIGAMD